MIRVIIHGVNGFMGRVLTGVISEEDDMEVVAGIDVTDNGSTSFPVYTSPLDCNIEADIVIDFSVASAVDNLMEFCSLRKLPVVLCTTGLSDEQLKKVEALSKEVAVLRSANMSVGVNTLMDLLKRYAPVFAEAGFDIEIVEKHHNRKLDAPSGTALALADSINKAMGNKYTYEYDRHSKNEKRKTNEIGIVALRGGNIVGEHEVVFAGMDEVVTFKHTATSRGVFAKGAVQAAKYLYDKSPGIYSMEDVIS